MTNFSLPDFSLAIASSAVMFVAGMSSEIARRLQKLATTMFAAVSARNLRRCGAGLQCSMHIDEPLSGVGQLNYIEPRQLMSRAITQRTLPGAPLANPHLLQKGSLVGSAGSLRLKWRAHRTVSPQELGAMGALVGGWLAPPTGQGSLRPLGFPRM